jgi:hypothetical protein
MTEKKPEMTMVLETSQPSAPFLGKRLFTEPTNPIQRVLPLGFLVATIPAGESATTTSGPLRVRYRIEQLILVPSESDVCFVQDLTINGKTQSIDKSAEKFSPHNNEHERRIVCDEAAKGSVVTLRLHNRDKGPVTVTCGALGSATYKPGELDVENQP